MAAKVYRLYQLLRNENGYVQDGKKCIRDRVVITEEMADELNQNWQSRGKFYELDKKATEKHEADIKALNEKRKRNKEMKEALAVSKINEALGTVTNSARNGGQA